VTGVADADLSRKASIVVSKLAEKVEYMTELATKRKIRGISNVTKVPITFKGKVSREEHGFPAQNKTCIK
jgi:hypothetical protein